MADEKEAPKQKKIRAFLTGEEEMPTHYVNMANVRADLDTFFLTVGTVLPTERYVDDTPELVGCQRKSDW
jgi:hypothetical protein